MIFLTQETWSNFNFNDIKWLRHCNNVIIADGHTG